MGSIIYNEFKPLKRTLKKDRREGGELDSHSQTKIMVWRENAYLIAPVVWDDM